MDTTSTRQAINDMAHELTGVFKKYTRSTRTLAWDRLTSKQGEVEIKKLLQDPNRPINTFSKLIFKEWLKNNAE